MLYCRLDLTTEEMDDLFHEANAGGMTHEKLVNKIVKTWIKEKNSSKETDNCIQ